ncbi:GNAT family N-acetyltransferase [Actinosynnema pretiosum subsp. pretiosum]|uniref:GNAT family N-acetyltransferase n=1 Tax=Actinosynnema pretiosum subsp. pretiosum TaxID=103721 RepID=A0AA45L8H7_9PSEU|nr:GNAT family N-acetyltransferase [Actinosynnema pretiosum subsp. pretiosum]
MTEVRTRPYAGPADLRAMQGLARRIWTPSSRWHVGDLAWQRNQHTGREAEWPTALWEAGGEVVAWGWAELPGELALLVDPARPELAGAVLDWFAGVATAPRRSVTVLDAEPHLVAALEARGYERLGGPHFRHSVRALDDLPTPELPAGYRVRAVRGEEDVAARVAAHRAAWWPSRVTEESYRAVMGAWPYRPGLDWVVEGPDGRFAATCLIWFDERNGVGELEPVGVDPGLRRRGLGRAVCLAALGALREAGGRAAVVYPLHGHPDHPAPAPLYRGLGFREHARTITFTALEARG